MFAAICILSILDGLSFRFHSTLQRTIVIACYSIQSIVVLCTSITMTAAFIKFYKIVSEKRARPSINKFLIAVQISGLTIWIATLGVSGVFLMIGGINN